MAVTGLSFLLLLTCVLSDMPVAAVGEQGTCEAEGSKEGKGQSSTAKTLAQTVVGALGGDANSIATIKQLASQDVQSKIRGMLKTPAALQSAHLHLMMDSSQGVDRKLGLKTVRRVFDTLERTAKSAETRRAASKLQEEVEAFMENPGSGRAVNDVVLNFQDNEGEYHAFHVSVRLAEPSKWQDPAQPYFTINFAQASGFFEPAPDYIVISESKKGFLGSRSKDVIVPIHRGLTEDHVNQVMHVMVPRLAAVILKAEEQGVLNRSPSARTDYEFMPFNTAS